MVDDLKARLSELRALEAAATKGPWCVRADASHRQNRRVAAGHNPVAKVYAHGTNLDDFKGVDNAALIVAARNALPAILDRIEQLEAENERLREAGFWLAQRIGDCDEFECTDRASPNCHCSKRFAGAVRLMEQIERDRSASAALALRPGEEG